MVLSKVVLFVTLLGIIVCPPVQENADVNDLENELEKDLGLEYERYVKEVVQALESDPDFRKKLESADPEDIKKGKIADDLDMVHHNVRSKLDELKRQELERLRKLAVAEFEEREGVHRQGNQRLKIPGHVDHKNLQTFEKEDLRKLIVQTTRDLDEADKKRREDFKKYEMEKEFEHQQKLEKLDEEHKKEEEKEWEEQQKKHKEHPKLHHPGSKQQLEEVWEKQDHMEGNDWDPRTFFKLHDIDGNGVWDPVEVKALFRSELNKLYDPNAPEDDMRERAEEMERMREHVVRETDKNRDGLISFEEFLEESQKSEFGEDPGWQGIDEGPVYNQEEYHQYEQRRVAEIQRMVDQGLLPPQPHLNLRPPHGGQPQFGMPPPYTGASLHPNDIRQGGYHPNALPQQQYGAPPQQYGAPQQQYGVPPQQYGAPPQQYGAPQQQYGVPPQQYGAPQQQYGVPQQQYGVPQQYGMPQQQYGVPQKQNGIPQYGVPHNATHYVVPNSQQQPQYTPQVQAGQVPQYGNQQRAPQVQAGQVPQYGNQVQQNVLPLQQQQNTDAKKITPDEGDKMKAGLHQQYQQDNAAKVQQPVVQAVVNEVQPASKVQQPIVQPNVVPVSYQQAGQPQVQQPIVQEPQPIQH